MSRDFALHDENSGDRQVGTFSYDTERKLFSMHVDSGIPVIDLPLSLEILVHRGNYDIGHDETLRWVRARICPPGRHNIREILSGIGLAEYDEFKILEATAARCDKDGLYLKETELYKQK
jgi:hypothetical protein